MAFDKAGLACGKTNIATTASLAIAGKHRGCKFCRNKAVAAAACKAVAAVVAADSAGETLLEVVQLVADLVKKRDCRCAPEVQFRNQ